MLESWLTIIENLNRFFENPRAMEVDVTAKKLIYSTWQIIVGRYAPVFSQKLAWCPSGYWWLLITITISWLAHGACSFTVFVFKKNKITYLGLDVEACQRLFHVLCPLPIYLAIVLLIIIFLHLWSQARNKSTSIFLESEMTWVKYLHLWEGISWTRYVRISFLTARPEMSAWVVTSWICLIGTARTNTCIIMISEGSISLHVTIYPCGAQKQSVVAWRLTRKNQNQSPSPTTPRTLHFPLICANDKPCREPELTLDFISWSDDQVWFL